MNIIIGNIGKIKVNMIVVSIVIKSMLLIKFNRVLDLALVKDSVEMVFIKVEFIYLFICFEFK